MHTFITNNINIWLRMLTTAENATSGIHTSPIGIKSYWISK